MRPTELIRRFSGLLAIGLLAGVYWLSSRLGGHLEPCVITAKKVAGMSLSPDAVQTLIDERLVRIDPDRSTRSIESYVCQEGVAEARVFLRVKEILEAEDRIIRRAARQTANYSMANSIPEASFDFGAGAD